MNKKISIVIPVYNTSKYLKECLDSVIGQTFKEIEIICVNDGSSDDSLNILEAYKNKDNRIKIINFDTNRSLLQARKAGVKIATGQYLMFLDSDDSLDLNSCEMLLKVMKKVNVDIVHFGTYVEPEEWVLEETVKWAESVVEPVKGFLYGADVAESCFRDRKFIWNVWGKLYRTNIVCKAYEYVSDIYLNVYEDFYGYFLIVNEASSYFGIMSKFYHYKYGRGMTGYRKKFSEREFKALCQIGIAIDQLREFLLDKNELSRFQVILDIYRLELYNRCLEAFCDLEDSSNKKICRDIYVKSFKL